MDKLPKRSDDIYKEIEQFEDYEFTNCIAYEMAIRNDEVKSLLKEIINYPLYEYSPYEDKHFELDKKLEDTYFINFKIRKHIENGYEVFIEKYHKEFHDKKGYVMAMQVFEREEFEKEIINNLLEYEEKVQNYYYNNFERLEFVRDRFITEKDQIHDNSKPYFSEISIFHLDGKLKTPKLIKKEEEDKYQTAIIEDRKFLQFKRPRLLIPKEMDNTISLKINPNLPLEDLKAYIEHIKKEYDKDNSIVKNPLELLGEKFKKAELFSMTNKRTDKINKEHVADMFFIYDASKKQIKKSMIQRSIVEYYNEKYPDKFIPNMDYKTINKYLEIAVEYINNLKYKELITGVKN